jgi:hypothetical protein
MRGKEHNECRRAHVFASKFLATIGGHAWDAEVLGGEEYVK